MKEAIKHRSAKRVEFGDWQTPPALAAHVCNLLLKRGVNPTAVIEPTCGRGSFVKAATAAFPQARVVGFELSGTHLSAAQEALSNANVELQQANFFDVDWKAVLGSIVGSILVIGNPPWVTSSTLGLLSSENLPEKVNFKQHRGLDAMTGKANFDISEWMILRLLTVLQGREHVLAMLCKSSVARRVLEVASDEGWNLNGDMYRIDAKAHFNAAVDAVLLLVTSTRTMERAYRWGVYDHLDGAAPARHTGIIGGTISSDLDAFIRTRTLAGRSEIEWRSGVKHDCSAVMELRRERGVLVNGLAEIVDIEDECLYPMHKGSDVANRRSPTDRYVIVTQHALGEDTSTIRERAPKTWAYLTAHADLLAARKSSIYLGQPQYAMFGIGDYSFAPFKVAICGLYKHLTFQVIGPANGRPVMLDDTSYFLPCIDQQQAELLARSLNGKHAQEFLRARVFWDAKRPVNKALLQALSLDALLRVEGVERGLGTLAGVKQIGLAGIG